MTGFRRVLFRSVSQSRYEGLANVVMTKGWAGVQSLIDSVGLSDSGYATYLGTIYSIFGKGVIVPRLIKALLGAFATVLIYRVASRNFGEEAGRISGIFYMLMPNLILYTGSHLKEAEMVFLVVAFIERADYVMRSKSYNFINIAVPIILAGLLVNFR